MQSPQNGCVTEAITPTSPAPSTVAPAPGDLAAVVRLDAARAGSSASIARTISARRHDVVEAPAVGRADVHVLDEAHDVARAAEVRASSSTWSSFTPRLTTALILTGAGRPRPPPRSRRARAPTGKSTSFIARKIVVVQRVEADGHAPQARVGERLRLLRRAARRSSSAPGRAGVDPASCATSAEVAPQQRLAAGEAHLPHAVRDEDARHALDLLEASGAPCGP